eukprot:PITA_10536
MFLLQKRLKHIKIRLKEWNKKGFGNIFEGKKYVEGNMQELNQTLVREGFDKVRNEQATKYQQEWENFCKQEEIFWRQKSRVQWLKEEERNTRFFHRSTVESCSDREQYIRVILGHIPKPVSNEENFNLNRLISEDEISQDVLNVVEDSRRDKTILKVLNTTFIAMIPKQDSALTPDRFRPIALCNVVYKIISKVVANRLKPLLPTLVSGEQSGYVEAKAYDKLNWNYIIKVLMDFGFDHNWIKWVMALVTLPSFSILANGSPLETFIPSRGLIQGDPLSPFPFILMMEGLGRSMRYAKEVDKVKGIKLTEDGQALTHQQFVDDTMLQGIPMVKEALAYKQILRDFAMASGMEVNLTKSNIFFFNTHIVIQRNISRILGFQRDILPSKYLGVPLTTKPFHKSICELVISKLQYKIRKWTFISLNLAGRLVLTKVVLQSILVFMLSALPAPKGVLQQSRNLQSDFLWGKGQEIRKWALVAWEKIYKPKNYGGLSPDDPKILSKDLGAKLWWRWVKYLEA